jgi:two-component system OmpR family sensor kinase
MTLRTRLVLALVALSTVGLAVFGVATYTQYRRDQERQLDRDLRANARGQAGRLLFDAQRYAIDPETCAPEGQATTDRNGPNGQSFGPPEGGGGAPGQGVDAYAALISPDGTVRACTLPVTSTGRPDLPDDLTAGTAGQTGQPTERFLDTGTTGGSGSWRVLVLSGALPTDVGLRGPGANGGGGGPLAGDESVVVAVRTDGLQASLDRLLRIELVAAAALLTTLGAGAWLVLRRGLRPLEEMADAAATITAGDLSHRVEHADDRTEVGQLGLALNTMLDGIERSFDERDATEAKLRQFLADASHELRTPLTSIQGFAELFRLADQQGPEAIDRLDLPVILRRIEQESDRMKRLVEDLLLLARLDELRPFDPVPVDLAVLAADACTDAAAVSPDRAISLDAPEAVVVAGQPDHLRQALANLLANARTHTPAGTPIEVTVAANPFTRRATVSVRDHGPGLDAAALGRVFDRFWQADAARVGSGAGLGLSIVAGIAEEHGGTASAGNAPDGGAVFRIELPYGPASPGSSPGGAAAATPEG